MVIVVGFYESWWRGGPHGGGVPTSKEEHELDE